jgi:hypothetical protein
MHQARHDDSIADGSPNSPQSLFLEVPGYQQGWYAHLARMQKRVLRLPLWRTQPVDSES